MATRPEVVAGGSRRLGRVVLGWITCNTYTFQVASPAGKLVRERVRPNNNELFPLGTAVGKETLLVGSRGPYTC